MRTGKQQQASRENGARSNGPVTADGKATSAKNSTKHGLTARSPILLTVEDQQAFANMREEYEHLFRPVNIVERQLVDEMVSVQWRRQRAEILEAETIGFAMDRMAKDIAATMPTIAPETRVALAYNHEVNESKTLANLQRIADRLSRQYLRLLRTFRELRESPIPEPAPEKAPEPEQQREPDPVEQTEPAPAEAVESNEIESEKTNPGEPGGGAEYGLQNG